MITLWPAKNRGSPDCHSEKKSSGIAEKFDPLSFTYRRVDCLYKLLICPFNKNIRTKSNEVFDKVKRAYGFSGQRKEFKRCQTMQKAFVREVQTKSYPILFRGQYQLKHADQCLQ